MEHNEAIRLKDLDRAKTQLYTNITHEFRTPLTVISGIADELEGQEKRKSLIKRNSEQLLDLVNQMLDLRKLESGAMQVHYEQADAVGFLRYIVEAFQSLAQSKQLVLQFSSNVERLEMDMDKHKWTRVLSNLISNAIKFTPEGGTVDVTVTHQHTNDVEHLIIAVSDTGIGIPAASQEKIFDRFYQVDRSSTRSGEGTGVGLTLVSEIVHLLKGEVSVESIPGEGSTFGITLPVTRTAPMTDDGVTSGQIFTGVIADNAIAAEVEEGRAFGVNGGLPQLLIIEDSPDVVTYLIACLEGRYELSVARDGQEGMEKAMSLVPDVIVSDVMMPRADGFEVCDTLKNHPTTSHIPIILLTAKADIQSRIEGLRRGADAYIAKPFHKQELLVELEKLIALRKVLQARYQSLDLDEPSTDPAVQIEDTFILRFREIVEDNIDDADFDVVALCREMGSSRSQLHRKMKALTGMSTSEFQRTIRLNKAKELLQHTERNISEIAYDVGFRDPNYFSKAFSLAYGHPPSKFRDDLHRQA